MHGHGVFHSGGKSYPVRAGQFFVIRPFEVTEYQADSQEPWEYIWIGFTAGMSLPEKLQTTNVFTSHRCGRIFSSLLDAEAMQEDESSTCAVKYIKFFRRFYRKKKANPTMWNWQKIILKVII